MLGDLLTKIGSLVLIVWGIAHLAALRSVVNAFGELSDENRRILTMEWIGGGLSLCFMGMLVLLARLPGGPRDPVAIAVLRACAAMLVAKAVVGLLTGARTSILPMRLRPLVYGGVATILLLGSYI